MKCTDPAPLSYAQSSTCRNDRHSSGSSISRTRNTDSITIATTANSNYATKCEAHCDARGAKRHSWCLFVVT